MGCGASSPESTSPRRREVIPEKSRSKGQGHLLEPEQNENPFAPSIVPNSVPESPFTPPNVESPVESSPDHSGILCSSMQGDTSFVSSSGASQVPYPHVTPSMSITSQQADELKLLSALRTSGNAVVNWETESVEGSAAGTPQGGLTGTAD